MPMDALQSYIVTLFFAAILAAAGVLIKHLGRDTVPAALTPVANAWTRAGGDPKFVRVSMWILFSLSAATFCGALLYGMYVAALDLGKKW